MEALNLHHLSLILDQELVIIPEDIKKYRLSEKLKARHAHHSDEEVLEPPSRVSEPIGSYPPEEEYGGELLKIKYEGNFDKGVLIIYQGSVLENSYREFLMKILGAVGCSLKDVALLPENHLQDFPVEILSHLNPQKCLVFGTVKHPLMQLKQINYEVTSREIMYLFADDLKEIAENIPLKKKLWTSLQVLFNINK